jgi:hypothetical protein
VEVVMNNLKFGMPFEYCVATLLGIIFIVKIFEVQGKGGYETGRAFLISSCLIEENLLELEIML